MSNQDSQADQLLLRAVQHHQAGEIAQAEALYNAAILLKPTSAEAHNNLGLALFQSGARGEARTCYERALDLNPKFAEAQYNMGLLLAGEKKWNEAIAYYKLAVALKSDFVTAYNNLGLAQLESGRVEESIASYLRAIAIAPGFAEAWNNLGAALVRSGRHDEATNCFGRAVGLKGDYAEAHYNLGLTLFGRGRIEEAIGCYQRALALKSDFTKAQNNLCSALAMSGRFDEAIAWCQQALAINPEYAEAHNNLGLAYFQSGRIEETHALHRCHLAAHPDSSDEHGKLLFTLNYLHDQDPRELFEEHCRWDELHARSLVSDAPYPNDRTPDRVLRIGYVSPDFGMHSAAYFIEGLLSEHDRKNVEVFCYSNVEQPDAITARMRTLVPHWHDITRTPDAQAVDLIRAHGIDILVDLAGHTVHNRLLLFARRPAPIQITWLGYSNTTGMSAIDYRLTDQFADPAEAPATTDEVHSEKLIRLPDIFACYRPPYEAPGVNRLPAPGRDHVTFGSLHTLAKLNDPLFELWAGILKQVPQSRLLVVAAGLNEISGRKRIEATFAALGISADRLDMRGAQSLSAYMELHHEIDLLLDSYPFTGHTIACHALWMGVPVVTLAGKVHRSRMVASVLNAMGLPQLIAHTPEEYVQIAARLALDLPALAELRASMRNRMQSSPVMDAPRFARNIEAAYRQIWQTWCK